MPFMPLDVARLRDSQLAIKASGDEFRSAVLLWCASWVQIPAASLPDDDVELAYLAGFGRDLTSWRQVREGALRGFQKCDDGRLYHPVVAEKAMEAWESRSSHRENQENEAERKRRERSWRKAAFACLRTIGVVPAWDEKTAKLREIVTRNHLDDTVTRMLNVTSLVTDDVTNVTQPVTVTCHAPDTAKTGTGTGTGTEKQKLETRSSGDDLDALFAEFWAVYPKKVSKQAAAKAWAKLKPGAELAVTIVADVQAKAATPDWRRENFRYAPHPATYLNQQRWTDEASAQSGVDDGGEDPLAEFMVGAI